MNVFAGLTRPIRLLTLGVALAAALAVFSLAQTRQADAQGPLKFPELQVESLGVKYLSGYFAPGYYLVFTVKNIGAADAGPFTVEVRNENGITLESHPISSMKAGGGRMFWHKLPNAPNCGLVFIKRTVLADSANKILELNEKNNILTVSDSYGPGPC